MESWYTGLTVAKMRVFLSETGYTNSELSLQYLEHIKEHLDCTRPKVLLMDQHGSHMDPAFTLKALEYRIQPYAFPGHLTHILQPLDVGVFQVYKHWHRKAVQSAIRSLDMEYNIASFFRDLEDIRIDTFKKGTIQGAFRKAGVWPISVTTALEKMKVYQPPEPPQEPLVLPITPRRFCEAENSLNDLQEQLDKRDLSSPIRGKARSVIKGTTALITYSILVELQLEQSRAQARDQQLRKTRSRRKLQISGALTTEEAHAKIAKKEKEKKEQLERRYKFLTRTTRNKIKKEYKKRGVIARAQEKVRVKKLKELRSSVIGLGNSLIPLELLVPIPDPEKELTKEKLELELQETLITFPEFSGVVIPDCTINLDPALFDPIASQKDKIYFSSDEEEIDKASELESEEEEA
jgi:hypothetical protein